MNDIKTDIVIVGAGPAGIFTALALLESQTGKTITIVEKGLPIEERRCPKIERGRCVGCDPCRITTGFSGAGAFSDGKLSLSHEVGGDLPELIGAELAQSTINRVDEIYLDFGADLKVEGIGISEEKADIRRRAIAAGLKLVDCPIRHLGTERAQEVYRRIERFLTGHDVRILYQTECVQPIINDGVCYGIIATDGKEHFQIAALETVVAAGRRGASWFDALCREQGIAHAPGPCDIGVRVEVRNEVMDVVNNVLYESKLIGYPDPFRDKVRTFCQNPSGFVSQENYDGGLAVVNGHSFKERKSPNTNLAILCSHQFKEPFDQPILYAQRVGELVNMLAAGGILVQRFGDIMDGKRTWPEEMNRSNVSPTMPDARPGDITSAVPYRTMTDIINFMLAVDNVVPGFAADETLLYSPELKFYSNRVKMDERFNTSIDRLHCLGDASGWTRGLMMASVMGYLMGQALS